MPVLDLGPVVGPKGEQGETGPQGGQGVQGDPGPAATINGVNTLTIKSGDNVTLKQEGAELEIGAVVPGKILNINGDFRKPVNRNGQAKYTGYRYTIDAWKPNNANDVVTLMNGCIRVQLTKNSNFNQLFNYDTNKIYTASFLFGGNSSGTIEVMGLGNRFDITGGGLFSVSGTINNAITMFGFYGVSDGFDAYPIAAILEEGDHQTHFRQNADGEWEIIDPVDYDLQYLLCSQYSPTTGEWVGLQHSNTQMLDNAYWANKDAIINQRGQEKYTVTNSNERIHTVDMWRITNRAAISIEEDGLLFQDAGQDAWANFSHPFHGLKNGETYTLSLLYKSSTKDFLMSLQYKDGYGLIDAVIPESDKTNLLTVTVTAHDVGTEPQIVSINSGGTAAAGSIKLIAAKLDLGPVQTLAHKEGGTWVLNDPPPDPALELLKCQRYMYLVGKSVFSPIGSFTSRADGDISVFAKIPEMRIRPSISLIGTFRAISTNDVVNGTNLTARISGYSGGNILFSMDGFPGIKKGDCGVFDTYDTESYIVFDANYL